MTMTKEIDGNTYETQKMLPKEAVKIAIRLMKMIAPLAGCFGKLNGGSNIEDLMQDSGAMNLIGAAFASVDEDEFTQLLEDLCKKATKNGNKIAGLNTAFADEEGNVLLIEAVKVAVFVVTSNFNKKMLSMWGNSQAGEKAAAKLT